MRWTTKTWMFLLHLAVLAQIQAKRHVIYWDAELSKEFLNVKTGRVLNVQIGQFMDILCPQSSLMNGNSETRQPMIFDIFNVTKPYYDECSHEGRKNFIFSCNKPERENKLTIKFQLISPSPLGFRFQYCQDYYFVAVPRDKDKWGDGCHSNSSTRLHIKVACRRGAHHHTTTKRLSKSSTVPPKWNRPDSDLDSDYDLIVHPSVVSHVTSKTSSNPKTSNGKPKVLEQRAGENSGSNLEPTLLILMLVTLLFFITLTSST